MSALVKHRRRLEDFLLKSDLDISNTVTLTFSKDASMSSDKRAMTQPCYCVFSNKNCRWIDSEPVSTSVLGPLPRLRVSDMQGYDPETGSRPGAAARIEQNFVQIEFGCSYLVQIHYTILLCIEIREQVYSIGHRFMRTVVVVHVLAQNMSKRLMHDIQEAMLKLPPVGSAT